jgi:hypothetical protein
VLNYTRDSEFGKARLWQALRLNSFV